MGGTVDQVGCFIGIVNHIEQLARESVVVNIFVAFIADHIMSLLSLVVILKAIPRLKTYEATVDSNPEVMPRPMLSIVIFILTLIFIGVLDFGILSFMPAGIIYLSVIGYLMTNGDLKRFPWVIGFSIILTVSIFYIFTKLFYIDLP